MPTSPSRILSLAPDELVRQARNDWARADPSPTRLRVTPANNYSRAWEILELVSRTIEADPDAGAPAIRIRAHLSRRTGDEALELLLRAGFIRRGRVNGEDAYRSVRPYRASVEAPHASFADVHAVRASAA